MKPLRYLLLLPHLSGVQLPKWLVPMLFLLYCGGVQAQQRYRLQENNQPGTLYRVSARVELSGQMTLPSPKGKKPPQSLKLQGKSLIDYDERILKVDKKGKVLRTARNYRKLKLWRKVGNQEQSSSLRAKVHRLIVLRHRQMEVPFSPDGPLMWNEIDLVRTDVFAPALAGLLPGQAVGVGSQWKAASRSIQDLTDFEQIKSGSLSCRLEKITNLGGRPHAYISFSGTIKGIGQDGLTKQVLDGSLYFDLRGGHLSYLTMQGTQFYPDQKGNTMGKIEGTFVMTRQPLRTSAKLTVKALQRVGTEPTRKNTRLLHHDPTLGIKFLYSRRWHIAGEQGNQITLQERGGSTMLLTIEPTKRVPTGAQFAKESQAYLRKQKAKIESTTQIRRVRRSPRLEDFAIDVSMGRKKFRMYYLIFENKNGGAVIASRLLLRDLQELQKDVIAIVASIELTKKQQ